MSFTSQAVVAVLSVSCLVVAGLRSDVAGAAVQLSVQKQQVLALLKSIETGESGPVAVINPAKYIQHNLAAADGLAGFAALMKQLPRGSARVNTRRVLQDGNFVVTHTEYNFVGPKIGFDIFRFENGKIVEHWDNLQETAGPNPSGHTMIDGPTEITDRAATDANKALVKRFVDDILVNNRGDKLASYFDRDSYIQHNPGVGDKGSTLLPAITASAGQRPMIKFDRVHTVLGEGNFVLAVSEGTFGGTRSSFYDLYRVQNGKIAEHWDTIETIPPQSEWKNQNGKFGF